MTQLADINFYRLSVSLGNNIITFCHNNETQIVILLCSFVQKGPHLLSVWKATGKPWNTLSSLCLVNIFLLYFILCRLLEVFIAFLPVLYSS